MKVGVLGSGNGSNLQAILDAIKEGRLKGVEVAVVLSDVPDSRILERARQHKIPAQYIDPGSFKTKLEPQAEQQYSETLRRYQVEVVALAGFMRVVKSPLLHAFPYSIINIHPSLLPAFRGLEAWKQALDYGAKITGCTVHFVNMDVDGGPIIAQACVAIEPQDTPETLHARIQKEEHRLYPQVLQWLAEDKVHLKGRSIVIQ